MAPLSPSDPPLLAVRRPIAPSAARRPAVPARPRPGPDGGRASRPGPATSVWLPSGRPRTSRAARAASSSASRSMPGRARPSRAASTTRSSVAMLPVAPAGTGQPPSSPKDDSKRVQPASSAASTLARPWPRVLWKCAVSSTSAPSALARAGEEGADLARVGHPGGVAEADLRRARRGEPARRCSSTRSGGHVALVGAAEATEMTASQRRPAARARGQDALEAVERLGDRAVDVAAVVGLGGAEEDVDLVEAVARARSAFSRPRSLGISTETATSSGTSIRRRTSVGVGQLRDARRRGRSSWPRCAAGRSGRAASMSRTLSSVGDHLGLVLEAVARPDLADAHGSGVPCPRTVMILAALPSPVSIIGASGALGFGLAVRWARAGVPVVLGSRDAARARRGRRARPRGSCPTGDFEGWRTPRRPAEPRSSCSACRSATSPRR